MGWFSKVSDLKKPWKKIKEDAEKARGGKKPGGKMGFEAAIDKVDALMQAKEPNYDKIAVDAAALAGEMLKYAASLPTPDENKFIADIRKYTDTLKELAKAALINKGKYEGQSKKLQEAAMKVARMNQIAELHHGRLQELRGLVNGFQGTVKEFAALQKEIAKVDSDVQKCGAEMGKWFQIVMTLDNG